MAITNLRNIPFEQLTLGQAQLSTSSLLAYKYSIVAKRKNNTGDRNKWLQRSNALQELVPHIHNTAVMQNLATTADSYVSEAITESRALNYPALRTTRRVYTVNDNGLANLNNTLLPFDPTPQQVQECIEEGNKRFGNNSSRTKSIWVQSCIDRLPMKNILNQHIGKSGGVLLYPAIKKTSTVFNTDITRKDTLQARWIAAASNETRLSQRAILDVLQANVIDEFKESPENLEQGLGPYMAPLGSTGALTIQPQTKTPDVIFKGNGTLGAGGIGGSGISTGNPLIDTIINIGIVIFKIFTEFKTRESEAKKRTDIFNSVPDIEENIIFKCFDMNGIETESCDSEDVALKRCFDAETEEEILCPEDSNGGGGNALLYVGGGILLVALVSSLGRNRSNKNQ